MVQLPDEPDVVQRGEDIQDNARCDESCAKPNRKAVAVFVSARFNHPKLLQKQTESRDDESKSHQRQARANPCEQRPFGGKIVADAGMVCTAGWIHFAHWIHPSNFVSDEKQFGRQR